MKNILLVSYAYTAAVIGAGFASGQEILCYFVNYGRAGFLGVIISVLCFSLFAFIITNTCIRFKTTCFLDFAALMPGKYGARILKLTAGAFSFAVFSVMLSAFGSICSIVTGISPRICALFAAVLCAVIFCRSSAALSAFNGTIGILLSSGIAFSCFYILMYREHPTFSAISAAAQSACIYSGYNLVSVIPSLVVLSGKLKSKVDSAAVSIISGMAIFILMSLIFAILSMYSGRIPLGEFPMLTMAARQSNGFMIFYGAMLAAAIVSTLFASSAGIAEAAGSRRSLIFMLLMSMPAYALSGLGFGKLVEMLYRIAGIIGIIICMAISVICIKNITSSKSADI